MRVPTLRSQEAEVRRRPEDFAGVRFLRLLI